MPLVINYYGKQILSLALAQALLNTQYYKVICSIRLPLCIHVLALIG